MFARNVAGHGIMESKLMESKIISNLVIADLLVKLGKCHETLTLIAAPIRPDGTWNGDRLACKILAEETLKVTTK